MFENIFIFEKNDTFQSLQSNFKIVTDVGLLINSETFDILTIKIPMIFSKI